jgi:outer membrane protein assembly factor BamB
LTAKDMSGSPAERRTSEEAAGIKDFQRKTEPALQRFGILALNRGDGSVAWKSVAAVGVPHEAIHEDGTWASSSALTDGEQVFAYFGSRGLYAYDLAGKKLWDKQFEAMQRRGFGEGSSPALYGDTLVIQRDHDGDSIIMALDKNTGKELWSQARDERVTWATPLIVLVDGKPQVITNGSRKIRSYDLASGKLIWECAGMTANAVPTPVERDGIVYLTSGFGGSALMAVRLAAAKGDITDTPAVLWKLKRHTPYVPSPLLLGDQLYFLKGNNGLLSAANLQTGKLRLNAERLGSIRNIYASPTAAAGLIFLVGYDGNTEVFQDGDGSQAIATNTLDDAPFASSPALVGDAIYLRGEQFLYCIASQ